MSAPHVDDAERTVLGAVMLSPTALTDVAPVLTGDDFHLPAHETIWDTILALHITGVPVDVLTVSAHLTETGDIRRVGGAPYLHDLISGVTTTSNALWHARIIRDQATRRRLVLAATRTEQLAVSGEGTAADLAAMAMQEVTAAYRPDPTISATLVGDLADEALDRLESPADHDGVLWPWVDVNHVLNPMAPGNLLLVAGRPGCGKSVALVDIARHAAVHQGKTVVLQSLEMSTEEVMLRILSAEARVPLSDLQHRTISVELWKRLADARVKLQDAPLHVLDTPAVGIVDIRASITRFHPDVLLLDYLQLAQVNPKVERRQGLEEFTRALKLTAKSEGIPIVAAAQLGRGPELRTDHRPQLSDLRETGGLENDSDVVVLMFRPDYYDPESARAGEVDMIVGKQRNGPTGTVTLIHQLHYARIVDAAAF